MPEKNNQCVILDGKAIADQILLDVRKKILETDIVPGLAAVLVGDDPASSMYVNLKEKAAEKIGMKFSSYLSNSLIYPDIDEFELEELIKFLNKDPEIHGILLQLPLPKEFDQNKIVKLIDPKKDADGFNGGKVVPPTVAAIVELLKATGEKMEGKKTLIIGKSDIFVSGIEKYLKELLKIKSITAEKRIPKDCDKYDIIIISLGQAGILKKKNVKTSAIIIDVGINKKNGKTVGDADPDVADVASFLSPVPGGVGPLTVACLMRNVFELAGKS